ncbi:MAG: hypothetical protein U0176_04155 [Bacteroidia bacterium]
MTDSIHYDYYDYSELKGTTFIDIDSAGARMIRSYHTFPDKGPMRGRRRITLLPEFTRVKVGDTIRIFHIYEDIKPGGELMTMGPKPVRGVWVDGVCNALPDKRLTYPGLMMYDGIVRFGPDWDYNFQLTRVTFTTPGEHQVIWKVWGLKSNMVRIWVE